MLTYTTITLYEFTKRSTSIHREITELSNNTAYLCYHHVADNRGVLTNLIHNAALGAIRHSLRQPILYAPSGVVYLTHKDAPPLPAIGTVVDATVARVQQVSAQRLSVSLTGFQRDGKGLKSADYYELFFDLGAQVRLAAKAAFKHIPSSKKPKAGERFTKIREKAWFDPSIDLDLPDDIRVDQLAEWCCYVETLLSKQDVSFDITGFLLDTLQLADVRPIFDAIPRDNRAGGVGYHWYFAAGYYLKRHPGYDPTAWQTLIEQLAERLANTLAAESTIAPSPQDAWAELRAYTKQIFSSGPTSTSGATDRAAFVAELTHYQNAKRTGRGRTAVCSLCSSSFEVAKQQEAAILFSPMVYSNKMPLHGATAIRDICPICSLEIMLRQLLMNRSNATGRHFEGRQIRYLSFYPTYFFSPETLEVFRLMHNRIQRLSFTELRRQLLSPTAHNGGPGLHLDAATLQRLEPLLLAADELGGADTDRYVRMHFPEHEPITFYFLGIPPASRDAKDAESWVHPAFLALLIPVCLDVKVVASASPLPLFREADEFPETVFLDGAHSFVQSMVGKERINIDEVLPSLQRLIVEYLIHLDAHSRQSRGRWDYRWSDIPPLARDLAADAAYACYYLKKWQRNAGIDTIPFGKAQQYMSYLPYLAGGEHSMSHARTFVDLYRQFYRARRQNSNNILRPLSVAANAILSADRRLFDREGLVEVVRGELRAFTERVQTDRADGMLPPGSTRESREEAMSQFAAFFPIGSPMQ